MSEIIPVVVLFAAGIIMLHADLARIGGMLHDIAEELAMARHDRRKDEPK